MKLLYINTCSGDVLIKLFKGNKIIKEESVIGQRNNSQFIMPTIKKVLDNDKPEAILVTIGPGSFTGVRLGVTIAKTFAYILNIPIYTVTTLEEMAYSINEKKEILAIKETNGYYIGLFDEKDNLVGDYKYLKNAEFDNFKKEYEVKTDIPIDYSKVIKKSLSKEAINHHAVKPLYVKKIEVET